MALKCTCGWIGVNLVPDAKNDQALCPECGQAFVGIKAEDANLITKEDEQEIVNLVLRHQRT